MVVSHQILYIDCHHNDDDGTDDDDDIGVYCRVYLICRSVTF